MSVKLVVPSRAVAFDRAETAPASAAPEEGPAATLGTGAPEAEVLAVPPLSQPAIAKPTVAIVARLSPASRGVRMYVLPDVAGVRGDSG
ncbi:hypothetical protein Ato02nite_032010 [Paractinoplanes toevensis]|uniref:Uncharacterized protein n=1 Tax=Paractinoplanes toevensis TaxID=571911 RepID=A0A919T9M2_9ACTN|nr:hypothetical protein Ato02nite_032010 [Actinoplanes toevensis]